MLSRVYRLLGGGQLLLTALLSQVTAANGTYFAAGGNNDHIAVAIDSRLTADIQGGKTIFNDHYCKILPLSESEIFFFSGVNGQIDTQGHTLFDAEEIAQRVYKEDQTKLMQDQVSQWASIMMDDYKTYSSLLVNPSDPLIEGYFVGYNTNEIFGIYGERISGPPTQPSADPLYYDINSNKFFEMSSSADILREFANGGTTEGAKEALQLLGLEARGKSPTASTALLFETMVTVAGQSGNAHIGGETAAMTMERGDHIWHWVHRPNFCPKG